VFVVAVSVSGALEVDEWIVEVAEVRTDVFVELLAVVELLSVVEFCVTSRVGTVEVVSVKVGEDLVVWVLLVEVYAETELPVEVEVEVKAELETLDVVETLEEVVVVWKNPEPRMKAAPAPKMPITTRAPTSEAYPFFFIQELYSAFKR
jgi:hypothetical protein